MRAGQGCCSAARGLLKGTTTNKCRLVTVQHLNPNVRNTPPPSTPAAGVAWHALSTCSLAAAGDPHLPPPFLPRLTCVQQEVAVSICAVEPREVLCYVFERLDDGPAVSARPDPDWHVVPVGLAGHAKRMMKGWPGISSACEKDATEVGGQTGGELPGAPSDKRLVHFNEHTQHKDRSHLASSGALRSQRLFRPAPTEAADL